jgi:four helix bundle protein
MDSQECLVTIDRRNAAVSAEAKRSSDQPPAHIVVSNIAKAGGYRDLLVWRKSVDLVKEIYQLTKPFPVEERFGLVSQMRRAAVSIPSNIAEGQARRTTGEFIQFVSQAEGSLAELDTQLVLAEELGYVKPAQLTSAADLVAELKRMLNALRRALLKR